MMATSQGSPWMARPGQGPRLSSVFADPRFQTARLAGNFAPGQVPVTAAGRAERSQADWADSDLDLNSDFVGCASPSSEAGSIRRLNLADWLGRRHDGGPLEAFCAAAHAFAPVPDCVSERARARRADCGDSAAF